MTISDSIKLFETDSVVTVVVDGQHIFSYLITLNNPRRSDEFYILDAMSHVD